MKRVFPDVWVFGYAGALVLVVSVLLGGGCQSNPVLSAETVEQRAFAVLGLYQIVVEEAGIAVGDTTIPVGTRRAIQEVVREAQPVRRQLSVAYLEYVTIRGELAAGKTTEARVVIVAQQLERWVERLEPIVRGLVTSLGG